MTNEKAPRSLEVAAGPRPRLRGQNTVEYMMMLAMVVGVALIVGAAMKRFAPELFHQLETMMSSAVRGSYDYKHTGPGR